MGRQAAENPLPPPAKSRRDTQIFNPLPNPPRPSDPKEPELSFSEPTLRFPRPQGNQSLAHWISSSDPDIMHLTSTPVDDTGLSESTYELIGGTDTESQDGNFTDNISESVGSLEFQRPDDVVSLTGTEHTCDEESVADTEEHQLRAAPELVQFPIRNDTNEETDTDDDDSSSKASLEYADHSLRTPSILTPDASRYMTSPSQDRRCLISAGLQYIGLPAEAANIIDKTIKTAVPGLLALILAVIFIPRFFLATQMQPESSVAGVISTTSLPSLFTSTHNQPLKALTTASNTAGVALIPVKDSSTESRSPSRSTTVSFAPHGKHDVLIHAAPEIRKLWKSKRCFEVEVTRSNQPVDFTLVPDRDGMLVQFPDNEARGVVSLSMLSKCRLKTHRVIKVHFGKGIMVDAFERTKSLAQDLSDLVPVAAHEAERCLAGAKRVCTSASEIFAHAWLVGTEKVQDLLTTANTRSEESLGDVASRYWKLASATFDDAVAKSDVVTKSINILRARQTQLKLGLLDAQVSARMWWLKVQGKDAEYHDYAAKAQAYLQMKKLAAEKLLKRLQSRAKLRA